MEHQSCKGTWRGARSVLRVRAERLKRGWTQAEVGRRCGIDQGTLSRLEHGAIPAYPGWARRLSNLFKVGRDKLFQEVSPDEPKRVEP